jgi:hypothetical protein
MRKKQTIKKSFLYRRSITSCTILLCLFLTQCKKDPFYKSQKKVENVQQPIIKEEAIKKWFGEKPLAKLVSLDWSKAKQGVVNGKNVVRVPLLNFANTNKGNANKKVLSSGKNSTNDIVNSNYYPSHAPEMFFIQNNNTGKLRAYLLNFVPINKSNEFGENGTWSGKLYEWNLSGDTVHVQDILQSKLKERYAVKIGDAPDDNNGIVKAVERISSNQMVGTGTKVSGIFGWLVDVLGDFVGWIGHLFGLSDYVPSTSPNAPPGMQWRLKDINWAWFTDNDTGTGEGGGGSLYTGAGNRIYLDYIPGVKYDGTNGEPTTYDEYPSPGGGPSTPVTISVNDMVAQYVMEKLVVTKPSVAQLLYNRFDIARAITDYIDSHSMTQEEIDFLNWVLDYLVINTNFDIGQEGAFDKLYIFKNLSLNSNQTNYINTISLAETNAIREIIKQDENINENKTMGEAFVEILEQEASNSPSTEGPKMTALINKIKSTISLGVVETAKLMRKVYLNASNIKVVKNNTSTINTLTINPIRSAVSSMVNFDAQTMGWGDLFNIWLFELGSYTNMVSGSPAIFISGNTNIQSGNNMSNPQTNALKNLTSVVSLRNTIKSKLNLGTLSTGNKETLYYTYNVNEYYGSLTQQNIAKIFLGSFNTEAYVLNKSGNSATILFVVNNVSGWESATRFIKAEGGNIGIIDDKARGAGLNLGGNFGQDIQWTETITW